MKILYIRRIAMEWVIAALVFVIFAKRGLKQQGKSIEVKEALGTICANTAVEAAELFEIEIKDLNSKNGKRA